MNHITNKFLSDFKALAEMLRFDAMGQTFTIAKT